MSIDVQPEAVRPEMVKPVKSVRAMIAFLVFNELASGFTQGFYSPLLPNIREALGATDASITWFMTLQTLSAAVCVPLLSRLGDMFGHRKLLRIAIVSTFVGSLVVALLPNYPIVLLARVIQGPLAVWLPLEVALIHGRATGQSARQGIGMLTAFLSIGSIVGTIAAGVAEKYISSLSITLVIPAIFQLLAIYAVFVQVPESPERRPSPIDVPGFAGLAIIMVGLLTGLTLVTSQTASTWGAVAVLAVSLLAGVVWVWWELRQSSPAVDVRLVGSRRTGSIHIAGFLYGMVLFGSQSPTSTFLAADPEVTGYGFAAAASSISLVLAAIMLTATLGSATFAFFSRKFGLHQVLVAGCLISAVALIFYMFAHTQMWQVWIMAVLTGFGMGLLLGGLPAMLAEQTPRGATGASVGVYNSLRSLGGATGSALFGAALVATTPLGTHTATITGYYVVWGLCAAAFLFAAAGLTRLQHAPESQVDGHAGAAAPAVAADTKG